MNPSDREGIVKEIVEHEARNIKFERYLGKGEKGTAWLFKNIYENGEVKERFVVKSANHDRHIASIEEEIRIANVR